MDMSQAVVCIVRASQNAGYHTLTMRGSFLTQSHEGIPFCSRAVKKYRDIRRKTFKNVFRFTPL